MLMVCKTQLGSVTDELNAITPIYNALSLLEQDLFFFIGASIKLTELWC